MGDKVAEVITVIIYFIFVCFINSAAINYVTNYFNYSQPFIRDLGLSVCIIWFLFLLKVVFGKD